MNLFYFYLMIGYISDGGNFIICPYYMFKVAHYLDFYFIIYVMYFEKGFFSRLVLSVSCCQVIYARCVVLLRFLCNERTRDVAIQFLWSIVYIMRF